MKAAIVGSRNFPESIGREAIGKLLAAFDIDNVTIISGGARGPDTWAEEVASILGFSVDIFYADWDNDGKGAGFKRNWKVVRNSDVIFALWDGDSRGTAHTIECAEKDGVPVFVMMPPSAE